MAESLERGADMISSENKLVLAKGLLKEIAPLLEEEKADLISFLRRLQDNPYSELERAHASGEFFASRILKDEYVLYWSLEYPDNLSLMGPLGIKLLALKRVAEFNSVPSIRESK